MPEPEVTWYKGDKQLKPKKGDKKTKVSWDVSTELSTLEIKKADSDDAGEYTVKGTNTHGATSATINVIVQEKEAKEKKKKKLGVKGSVTSETEEAEKEAIKAETTTVTETEQVTSEAKVSAEIVEESETAARAQLAVKGEVQQEAVEETEATETVSLGQGPYFEVAPQPLVVAVGETITVTCKIKGLDFFILNAIINLQCSVHF